jgi:hypothetical protein
VHRDALVQVQHATAVAALHDLDVLVEGRLLVNQPRLALHGSGWDRDEDAERGRDEEVAGTEDEAG